MGKYSIVGEMIVTKGISLLDERDNQIELCDKSPFVYICPFNTPFFEYDNFAKKSTVTERIIHISYDELLKLGYAVYRIKATKANRFRPRQTIIYLIGKIAVPPYGSQRLQLLPGKDLKIVRDIGNNTIRLLGKNAGLPHVGDLGGPIIPLDLK